MAAPILLDFDRFADAGLYLLFEDGKCLTLTRPFIDQMRHRYLSDPRLLPLAVREAPAYAPCAICPQRETALICHAIPTVFPFLEDLDRFMSYESVVAVYRADPTGAAGTDSMLHVSRTSMQRALQYVSILSLTHYCEVGRTYYKYFAGVIPFMNPLLIVERVYLNMYRDFNGDTAAMSACIANMRREFDVTVTCQIDRLRLFCRNDAFLNAFINTNLITQLLEGDMDALMREASRGRRRNV